MNNVLIVQFLIVLYAILMELANLVIQAMHLIMLINVKSRHHQ